MGKLWSIGIFEKEETKELFTLGKLLKVFNSRKVRLSKKHIHTYADPFLISDAENLYLFAEIQEISGKGYINGWKTSDLKEWENLGIILKEEFHLSYPFVFYDQHSSSHYLIPESSETLEVALYHFQQFPLKPVKTAVLLKGKFADSSLMLIDGIYYLITTDLDKDELQLYYSHNLLDENWESHPMSPISTDKRVNRNGGGFILINKDLYRIAQNCEDSYGAGIVVLKVNQITREIYEETIVTPDLRPVIIPKWQKNGRHHLSIAEIKNTKVLATDGLQDDIWLNKGLNFLFKLMST